LRTSLLRRIDADGWPRTDEWSPGARAALPDHAACSARPAIAGELLAILARAGAGNTLGEADIVRRFRCRGAELAAVCAAGGAVRRGGQGEGCSHLFTWTRTHTT